MAANNEELFQIYESDLAYLEQTLPRIADCLVMASQNNPVSRTRLIRIQSILSNVRWGYGPKRDVEVLGDQP